MKVSDKIIYLRKLNHMSQEALAEKLGISRQSISRWENDTALPDATNLLALSKLFHASTDELLNDEGETFHHSPPQEGYTILQLNTIKIAIIMQACFLNVVSQPWIGTDDHSLFEMIFKIIPLLLASIWMAINHHLEKDMIQRAKNTKIELVYCCIQTIITICGYLYHWGIIASILLLFNACYYVIIINPKYMNRPIVRK